MRRKDHTRILRTVHVFVTNKDNEVFLRLFHDHHLGNQHWPGLYSTSAASMMRFREKPEKAGKRALHSDLGITKTLLRFHGEKRYVINGIPRLIHIFSCMQPKKFMSGVEESIKGGFIPASHVHKMVRANKKNFTPTFVALWNDYKNTLFKR